MGKMTCEGARALFDAMLDGELSEKEQALLEKHLTACEDCRREYAALKAIHGYMRTLAVEIPPELHETVMASIKKEPKTQWLRTPWLRPLVAVCAAALVCITVIHSPLLDGMFAAKSEADGINMELAGSEETLASADLMDSANGSSVEDKSEAIFDKDPAESPEALVKKVYAIADSDLLLMLLNETEAMLCREDGKEIVETLSAFIYTQKGNTLTLEAAEKTLTFQFQNGVLYPTDEDTLDALRFQ